MADPQTRGFSMGWIPTLASLAGLTLLLALGAWQTNEYFDKKRRETLQNHRVDEKPISLRSLEELGDELNYRRVRVDGRIQSETQIIIKHRHHSGDPGSWLVQPLQLPEDDGRLLVNRGWIPFQRAKRDLGRYASPPADSQLVGLLYRLPDNVADDAKRRQLAGGTEGLAGRRTDWDTFDASAIYGALDGSTPDDPWVLVLAPRHTGDPYPVASYEHVTEPYMTSTRHLGYAVFWYTVALALAGIYLAAGFGALRSRPRGSGRVPNRDDG